ncbi:MAG: hypothetical protein M1371_06375 [Actinobacteria bacterium]|nr:hypothetical protein [Actinomycetota bacterium]
MEELTKRERIECAINLREGDRIPIFDVLQNVAAIEHYSGEKLVGDSFSIKTIGKAAQKFLDMIRGVEYRWPYRPHVERCKDGFIKKWDRETWWYIKRPFSDTKQLKEHIKRNVEEINNYRSEEQWTFAGRMSLSGASRLNYREEFLKKQKYFGDMVIFHSESAIGLDTAYNRAGLELFIFAYTEYPDLISEWIDALNLHEIKRVDDISKYDLYELSPVALVYCDLAYKTGLMFSPEFLRKELISRMKRLVNTWHKYNIKCIFHSDGDYRPILDDLVSTSVDGIHSMEPLAGWDMGEIKKKYPKLILVGNIDISQLLPNGTEEEVVEAVKKAVDDAAKGGGYILSTCSEIHNACKLENIIAMVETAWKYGRYK